MMLEVFLAIPLFAISALLTLWAVSHSHMIAFPDHRSSHVSPTPVGGGISFIVTYLLALTGLLVWELVSFAEFATLLMGFPIAVVGLLDDNHHVDHRVRLAVQTACSFFGVGILAMATTEMLAELDFVATLGFWISVPIALIWMTNLYNFMDGIDGLAGAQLCFVSIASSILLIEGGDFPLAMASMSLFAGGAGFLVWNWPPARIFMGDVGSGFAGFTFGIIALVSYFHGTMQLWSWVLLLAVFIVDATVTLFWRIISGERWHEAHRSHAYQHAAVRLGSHRAVTISVLCIDVFWLLPMAWFTGKYPEYAVYLVAAGLLPLVIAAVLLGAGRARSTRNSVRF